MRYSGRDLAFARRWKIAEQSEGEFAADGCKGVAVKEKKRRLTVTLLQEFERLLEGNYFAARRFPFRFARRSSFLVKAMLCSTSLARSSIDADDRLPVPVFDKRGSGLKR